jgi:hypothetical protein
MTPKNWGQFDQRPQTGGDSWRLEVCYTILVTFCEEEMWPILLS